MPRTAQFVFTVSLLTWTLGHEDASHVLLSGVIPSQPHPDDSDNDYNDNDDSLMISLMIIIIADTFRKVFLEAK